MNHVYRVIWSQVLRTWVVVAENAKGRGKSSSRKLVAAALALTASFAQAGPSGGQVTTGAGSISQSGSTTTVNQSSQNLSINWLNFNVAPQETVNFVQPSASAVAVNRISGNSGSVILGHINANGQVYLINPNGVLFGEGAQVNVGGLVASTLDINDNNVSGSSRSFSGTGTGSVINQGTINASNGGYVALVGNRVGNQGTITAQLGTVALGAGNAVTLSFGGNSLVHMQVDQSVLHNLAENGGLIQADGGQVIMTAGAKDTLLASIVNNTGVIEARTVQNHNGTIELLGGMTAGTVNVGGTLNASAPVGGDGGAIETSASKVEVASGANITTLAKHGKTGSWLIDPQDFTVAADGSGDITGATLSSELATTNTTLQSSAGKNAGSGNVNINDVVSWGANTTLTLTASNNVNFNANVTATGNLAGLVINPNTANGSEAASGAGVYIINNGASITLSGTTPSLSIAGQAYTVINSLGNSYDTTYNPTSPSLQSVAAGGNLGGHYALGSNIDASATSAWDLGQGFFPIGSTSTPFAGTFEGLGHTISNLTVNFPTTDYQMGLFGKIGTTGIVQNLGLVGGSVNGHYGVGSLAADNAGTIRNVYSSSTVNGVDMVGGLVGRNEGTITDSYATGTVSESANSAVWGAGGLLGFNSGGTVSNSYATGSVSGSNYVGGLVGTNFSGAITGSHASGSASGHNFVGGLVGESRTAINNSYATGNVSSSGTFAGGLIGRNDVGTVSNSYATGNVAGTADVGGITGSNYATITNAYAIGSVSGTSGTGGLVGGTQQYGTVTNGYWNTQTTGQASSMGGTGLTTAAMQNTANFAGFNFSTAPGATGNSWVMVDTDGTLNNAGNALGATFPMLASEYSTTITNAHQLQLMSMAVSANYVLAADIDASATNTNSGNSISGIWSTAGGFVPIGAGGNSFQGAFNGQGHTINNLTINLPDSNNVGLFSSIASVGIVQNVGLVNGSITGCDFVGAIAGWNSGLVNNSYSSTSIVGSTSGGSSLGGLVGQNSYGTISNSFATGNVRSLYSGLGLGGLAGENSGSIINSHASGNVGNLGESSSVGGLVGNGKGTISQSYATGNVSGSQSVGGLIGSSGTTISNSFATGNVTTYGYFGGGLVGNNNGTISSSYATGTVSAFDFRGGLIGYNNGTIINSFYDKSVNPNLTGISGQLDAAGVVLGMSTADMQLQANFTSATTANGNVNPGWDFTSGRTWNISPTINGGYPYLCTISGGCVVRTETIYVDPISGSSVYGHMATIGYVLDTSPFIGSGTVITDAAATGTISWSGVPTSSTNVGSYHIAYSNGLSLGNANYTLVGGNAASWNVTPATLTVSGQTAANKVYDGNNIAPLTGGTLAGLLNGDTVTLSSAGTFLSKNAGTGLGVTTTDVLGGTAASNYTLVQPAGLTANITPLALTVSATGSNRVYNGSVNDNVTLSSAGILAGDSVSFTDTSATFLSKNVGTGKAVTVSGISLTGTDAGNYTLTNTSATTSANVTQATLTVTSETAANKVYNGNVADTLSGGALVGVVSGDSVTLTQAGSFASISAGTGVSVITANTLGGTDAGNYTLVQPTGLVANITPATLTVTGESASSRVYNGGTVATLSGGSLSGVISGDSVTLGQTGSFASKNVGNAIVVTAADTLNGTDAGNYTLVQPTRLTANITPLAITATATGNNMVYNGTTNDTVTLTGNGVVAGDAVTFTDITATFASKNVGTNLAVSVTGISMTGADAGNYSLTNRNASTTANISPAPLTVTGETAANKVYNGSTATTLSGGQLAGLFAGDHLTLTQAGSFASKNAGTGVAVNVNDTVAGNSAANYVLVQPTNVVGNITPATVTVAATGTNMVYNGTVNDTVRLSSSGIVAGDVVGITDASATFAGKNVGSNLAVTVSGISISGADAGNYKLASTSATTSASITPAPLTVTGETAANKVYNGNTTASLSGGSLVGVLAGDTVTLNQAGSFASKNAGTNVAVTVADTLSGASATDYTIVQPVGVTANITPLSVTVTGQTATNRVYNGTTVDALTGGTLVGAISGDAVTLVQTGTLATKNVGTGIAVTVSDSLSGTSAGNYTLVQPTGVLHANVTPLAITVAATGTNMVYNGTVMDSVTLTGTGVAAGDAVSFADTSATFAGKNVGTGVRVSVSGISMNGTDAGNYTLSNTTASTSANITAAPLTVTGETALTRTYNGTTTATLTGGSLVGLIGSDSVLLTQAGAFTSKNAGTGLAVTTTDSISGANASNYKLAQPTGVTGTITPAALTVVGQRATNIVYNGSTVDPLTVGHLQGVLAGDTVTLISLGNFISPAIGTAIPVIVSDSLSGASAGNYILTQPTGLSANITHP